MNRLLSTLTGGPKILVLLCACLILACVAMIAVWACGYAYPLRIPITLQRRYELRCDRGSWQLVIASLTQIVGVQPSGAPIVETDARRIPSDFTTGPMRTRLQFSPWPYFQRGVFIVQTQQPFLVQSGLSSSVQTAANGVTAEVYAVPVWLPLLPAIGCGAIVIWRLRAHARKRISGHCANCGYDLRATTERCPECGSLKFASAATTCDGLP